MKNLRPIIFDDLYYLNKWKNDPEIFKYLGGGYKPTSIDEQKNWMDSIIKQTSVNKRFMIHPKSSETPVGMVGLYSINWIHRTAELGIYIGEKKWHGSGIAYDAYNEIQDYASKYLNLRKIKLYVVEENQKAVRFFKKNGFKVAGKLEEERFIEGKYCNLLLMERFI